MITLEKMAACGTEHGHQMALFSWAQQNSEKWPCLRFMFAIPSGGLRNARTAARLKVEGVKSGVPDIFLPQPMVKTIFGQTIWYSGLWIELKRPESVGKTEGKASKDQEKWLAYLNSRNYLAKVCFGYLQAIDCVVNYLS